MTAWLAIRVLILHWRGNVLQGLKHQFHRNKLIITHTFLVLFLVALHFVHSVYIHIGNDTFKFLLQPTYFSTFFSFKWQLFILSLLPVPMSTGTHLI